MEKTQIRYQYHINKDNNYNSNTKKKKGGTE